jgi:hypothetical protein
MRIIYELNTQEHKDLAKKNPYDKADPPFSFQFPGMPQIVLTVEGAYRNPMAGTEEAQALQKGRGRPRLSSPQKLLPPPKRGSIPEQITNALMAGPMTLSQISQATGRRRTSLYSTLVKKKYLNILWAKEGVGRGGVAPLWRLLKKPESSNGTTTSTPSPTSREMGDKNYETIREYLAKNGPKRQTDISKETGINIATVYWQLQKGAHAKEFAKTRDGHGWVVRGKTL